MRIKALVLACLAGVLWGVSAEAQTRVICVSGCSGITTGTAGSASTSVVTVQGIASMTPILATVTATNLDVQIGGSDTVTVTGTVGVTSGGSTGAAVPSAAGYTGINIGGNLVGLTGATEGSLNAAHTILVDPDTNAAVSYAGCTPNSIISAATVNETAIKATAGRLYWMTITSLDATPVYVKLYNDTTANIDETDTPLLRIGVPANSTAALLAGHTVTWPNGAVFSTAITFRATVGLADNDTAALTANEVLINWCAV